MLSAAFASGSGYRFRGRGALSGSRPIADRGRYRVFMVVFAGVAAVLGNRSSDDARWLAQLAGRAHPRLAQLIDSRRSSLGPTPDSSVRAATASCVSVEREALSTIARLAFPSDKARLVRLNRARIAAASSSGAPTGTTADEACPRASRAPATSVATTERPRAIASSSASDIPSQREGITATSAAASHAITSSRCPRASPLREGLACQLRVHRAVADEREPCSGKAGTHERPRSQEHVLTLSAGDNLPTHTANGTSLGYPQLRARRQLDRPARRGARGRVSTPFGMTCHVARMPDRSPSSCSAALTQTIAVVQRAATRSHATVSVLHGALDGEERPRMGLEDRRHPSTHDTAAGKSRFGRVEMHDVRANRLDDHAAAEGSRRSWPAPGFVARARRATWHLPPAHRRPDGRAVTQPKPSSRGRPGRRRGGQRSAPLLHRSAAIHGGPRVSAVADRVAGHAMIRQ